MVIISDFLDENDPERPLQYIADLGHELLLVHIWAPEDREPPWSGELDLVDAETGVHLEIDANQETRIAYTRAFDEYARRLQTLAMRTGGRYVGLPATLSVEEAIFGPMMRVGGHAIVFLLNLSPLEFLAIFGAVSAFVVTLYLLSRSRKRQRVATLRFWTQAQAPVVSKQRRRIQQPLSLVLQLVSIALLLLALGQLQWGSRDNSARDHVLLLDTSSWMSARSGTNRIFAGRRQGQGARLRPSAARRRSHYGGARRRSAQPGDRHGQRSPQRSRKRSMNRVRALQPSICSRHSPSQSRCAGCTRNAQGDVVYIGPGRVAEQGVPVQTPIGLRVIPVDTGAIDNVGLTRIGLRRSPADPEVWDVFVSARNYGSSARNVPLAVQFGGAPIANRLLMLAPGKVEEFSFRFRTKAAGWVEARFWIAIPYPKTIAPCWKSRRLKTVKVACIHG